MPHQDLQEALRTAYQNLQLVPLEPEQLKRFWVEYGLDVMDDLERLVDNCTPSNNKIIFTGHTGCGKSTLLAEFCHRISDRYFMVLFSIADLIEMSAINHVNILFSIAVQMLEAAELQKAQISPSVKKSLYQWLGKHTRTDTSGFEAELEAGYEAKVGIKALIASFFASVKGKLKANAVIRDEIKIEFEQKISDLVDRINETAIAVTTATKKPVLVVIDDLDKLTREQVVKILDNINPLFQPQFRIIYTVPITVMREVTLRSTIRTKTNNKIQTMRVAKFFSKGASRDPDAKPLEEPRQVFEQILYRRIAKELIEPEAVQQIILKSGGVLREFTRLASYCCDFTMAAMSQESRKPAQPAQPPTQITTAIVERAAAELRLEFAEPLGQVDYNLLKGIYEQNDPVDAESQRFLDLLHGLYILEYRNDELWYDLHPIVADLLRRKRVIY